MIYIDFVDLAYFFQYSHKPETLLLQTVKYSTSSKELNTARIYFFTVLLFVPFQQCGGITEASGRQHISALVLRSDTSRDLVVFIDSTSEPGKLVEFSGMYKNKDVLNKS